MKRKSGSIPEQPSIPVFGFCHQSDILPYLSVLSRFDRKSAAIIFHTIGIGLHSFCLRESTKYPIKGGMHVTSDEKKSWAEDLLRRKSEELGRLPTKGDFDDAARSRIKAFLGPWPRALEAAGLKPPKVKVKKKAQASSDNF